MENKDQPAFPTKYPKPFLCNGLTKREWLAGMAMQGLYSNQDAINNLATHAKQQNIPSDIKIARAAIAMAEVLLQELEKKE